MMRYAKSAALAGRAATIIPGGHHLSGRPLLTPSTSPMYFERAKGARIWDVDGNEYIDYVLAYGAVLLGYANEEVDSAAFEQVRNGSLLSLNHPMHLRFLETLLPRFAGAEMGVFVKTGSEATTAALRIARRATGRRKVARCGYHGWHDWCLPEDSFVPEGLRDQVFEFSAREPASLQAILDAHEIAAVIIAPEMMWPPNRQTFVELIEATRRAGAVFVLDEIKTAFRTAPCTLQQRLDIRPDLTTVSKALGNGWPIAAVVGPRELLQHAADMHLSATYHGDTACMAAALATLRIIDQERVADHISRLGSRLIAGLDEAARRHGIAAEAYGEPVAAMPFLRFIDPDPIRNEHVRIAFYSEVFAGGILLHPRHLWFISHAHSDADIARTLDVCDRAFAFAAR
jgi:glutamate-1-semialdehyde 2,1-aminomutase